MAWNIGSGVAGAIPLSPEDDSSLAQFYGQNRSESNIHVRL
jgi:hypothetical protein